MALVLIFLAVIVFICVLYAIYNSKSQDSKVNIENKNRTDRNPNPLIFHERIGEVTNKLEEESLAIEKKLPKETYSHSTDTIERETEITKIGYTPDLSISRRNSYPIILLPEENSKIEFSKAQLNGRVGKRGFTEFEFDNYLIKYFGSTAKLEFYNDHSLSINMDTQAYEPDHLLVNRRENLNLCIDIEIDEPYDGITKQPTHFIGSDNYRNEFFNKNGWIIIRFAEIQIAKNKLACCKLIANVIKTVMPSFEIPENLQQEEDIFEVPLWTFEEASKWAKENYRSQYLGIEFKEEAPIKPERKPSLNTIEEIIVELKKLNPDYVDDNLPYNFEKNNEAIDYYLMVDAVKEQKKIDGSLYYSYRLSACFNYGLIERNETIFFGPLGETRLFFEKKYELGDTFLGTFMQFNTPSYIRNNLKKMIL